MNARALPSGDSQLARRVEASVDERGPVLTIDELAKELKISRRTIEKRLRAGTWPINEIERLDKKHRWSRSAVDEFLATPRVPSRAGRRRKDRVTDDALEQLLAKPNRRRPRGAGKFHVLDGGR
jgi:excisionase family DNA binding protein